MQSHAKRFTPKSRYAQKSDSVKPVADEIAYVKVRYKKTDESESQEVSHVIPSQDINSLEGNNTDTLFAASVAAFAQQLRGGQYLENWSYADIAKLAKQNIGNDQSGIRGEFIKLVELAGGLSGS